MDEIEIEVFRAETKASRGITSAQIAELATGYDAANPVPICIGHPKSDTPAHGVISSFRADGNTLFATLKDVGSEIIDGIKGSKLLNRSMAFFSPNHEANPTPGKLAPRHLGFLGGSAPGIPGLKNLKAALSFSADGETLEIDGAPAPAIIFEAEPTPVFSVQPEEHNVDPAEQAAADLKAREDKLAADQLAFAATVTATRATANAAIVDGLVAGGKLLPKDADRAKLIFGALDAEPLEFEAGKEKRSASAELASLLSGGVKLAPVDEKRTSPAGEFSASDVDASDPKAIDSAARKLMADDSGLTFEAAVERVTAKQEG